MTVKSQDDVPLRHLTIERWLRVPGRGDVAVFIPRADGLPDLGESVLIDGSPYVVRGLEWRSPAMPGQAIGLVVSRAPE